MPQVTSKDGTKIAYETHGSGRPLVLVWGAMGYRDTPFAKAMRDELAKNFTVFDYDRRGRGDSGNTLPWSVQKEVEDLRAICQAAGKDPFVWGTSSGAALALEAAEAGVPMRMLAAHEPVYLVDEPAAKAHRDFERNVTRLIAEGRPSDAVTAFMRMVGVPATMVWVMKLLPFWKKIVASAHTIPYDARIVSDFATPEKRLREIRVPTVILVGTSTAASLKAGAAEVARMVPNARKVELPKQNHGVKPAALRPVLVEVLK